MSLTGLVVHETIGENKYMIIWYYMAALPKPGVEIPSKSIIVKNECVSVAFVLTNAQKIVL